MREQTCRGDERERRASSSPTLILALSVHLHVSKETSSSSVTSFSLLPVAILPWLIASPTSILLKIHSVKERVGSSIRQLWGCPATTR